MTRSKAGVVRVPRLALVVGALFVAAGGVACSSASNSADSTLPGPLGPSSEVVNTVAADVPGLTSMQTAQGMGGLLGYAKVKMPPAQFSQVAGAFPGADALMSEGMRLGKPSEMTGLSSLRGTLKQAGISDEQYGQLVSSMSNVVSQKVNPEMGQALAAAFK